MRTAVFGTIGHQEPNNARNFRKVGPLACNKPVTVCSIEKYKAKKSKDSKKAWGGGRSKL